MAVPAQKLHTGVSGEEPPAGETALRQQLKAQLNWCAYLGRSVDEEALPDLAMLLRQTAKTLRSFADKAEKQAQ